MLWEVEIRPLGRDGERERVCNEFDLLTHGKRGSVLVEASARGFLFEGDLDQKQTEKQQRDADEQPAHERRLGRHAAGSSAARGMER